MKVIVTGATGLVGGAVVQHCLTTPAISHILVLTRKPLADEITKGNENKLTVIIHEDFSTYPPELLDKLSGAEGCIWAIGGRANQFPDLETYKKVQVDYTVAAARAFRDRLLSNLSSSDKKFRFVFVSGKFSEWKSDKKLWFMADTRKVKGQVEKELCNVADKDTSKRFEVYITRPSGILSTNAGVLSRLTGKLYDAIEVDRLAESLVGIVLTGHRDPVIENEELLGVLLR